MKKCIPFLSTTFFALSILWFTGLVQAKIPEPYNIIYGLLPTENTRITLQINGEVIAMYTLGDNPEAGQYFVIRVPIDSFDPQVSGSARPEDQAMLYLDTETSSIETVIIGERGTIQRIYLPATPNYNCLTIPITDQPDVDIDGVGDLCDNCDAVANTDQDDSNNNGIGDACDSSDSDNDGMPDEYEYRLGLMVNINDRDGDKDGDLISNYNEYLAGTNPVPMCGDISDDTYVELDDLIETIQILSGAVVSANKYGDCNADGRIGLADALAILQELTKTKE